MALLLVLTMTTISTSVQQSLPRVSYIKAMDVWAFSCLFFVCASLLEISIVNVMARKEVKQKERGKNVNAFANSESKRTKTSEMDSMLVVNSQITHDDDAQVKNHTCKFERIHTCSRVLFPVSFALFNAIYWWWYLSNFTF